MKINIIKIVATIATFLMMVANLQAQSTPEEELRVTSLHPYNIVITSNFESKCLYDKKGGIQENYPNMLIACRKSTVDYRAYVRIAGATVASYLWEIAGGSSNNVTGRDVSVTWGDEDWGSLTVTILNSAGDTCHETVPVRLIDIPRVGSECSPNYVVESNGHKVIYVCEGSEVEFHDLSTGGESDIAGFYWRSHSGGISTTASYRIGNVASRDTVIHRVYNACGCYDEEEYYIEIVDGEKLVLDCYGSACLNDIVQYHATNPSCSSYVWHIEGGTLIAGQGTPYPKVQWDNPEGGYGVISLDGSACGGLSCPTSMSKRVAVISGGLEIEGTREVCKGDAVRYSLPQFGSTHYQWTVTPSNGVDMDMVNDGNVAQLIFNSTGDFHINVSYECDFLGCGPYQAQETIVKVRDVTHIEGDDNLCVGAVGRWKTEHVDLAKWKIYDLSDSNRVIYDNLDYTPAFQFTHSGNYLVTAEVPGFCGPTTLVVSVKRAPEAPITLDMDPNNRHTACVGSGVLLAGTPSQPQYSLIWEPVCNSATPQQYSGDSVTIMFPSEVCDVRVYQYDRVLQCMSSDYYVHTMSPLQLANVSFPQNITVCPNSRITWTNNVPDQSADGVLYEWKIEENKQYCASIDGNHMSNSVALLINDVTPQTFNVKLIRTYCYNSTDTITIPITIYDEIPNTLTISGPDSVCVKSYASFTGSGGDPSTYQWTIDQSNHFGNPVSHLFNRESLVPVTLTSDPYTYCSNRDYWNSTSKTVTVLPQPMLQDLQISNGVISVRPALNPSDYSFQWEYLPENFGFLWGIISTGTTANYSNPGFYRCIVTDIHTGCSDTVMSVFYGGVPGPSCNPVTLTADSYNYCDSSIHLTSSYIGNGITWTLKGNGTLTPSGFHGSEATIKVRDLGIYTVNINATSGSNCWHGEYSFTVDFIPDFELEVKCNKIIIHNRSRFIDPTKTVYITVSGLLGSSTTISFPVTQSTYVYNGGTLPFSQTFTLSGYGSDGNIASCVIGSASICFVRPSLTNQVGITTSYPYNNQYTCDNTPIQLTASLINGSSIDSVYWTFGDGSSFGSAGNSIYHTFTAGGHYSVSARVITGCGCSVNMLTPLDLEAFNDSLKNPGRLSTLDLTACPYTDSIRLRFSPVRDSNHYTWNSAPVHGGNPHATFHSGDYQVYVIDNHNCQREANIFVAFANAPTAKIYVEDTICCHGDSITLYGGEGPNPDNGALTYRWTVDGGGNGIFAQIMPATIKIAAKHPNQNPGPEQITITLEVTDNTTGCKSTAHEHLVVYLNPDPPSISFAGNSCIGHAPVVLGATSDNNCETHWSNGTCGNTALYYTHGLARAYSIDTLTHCKSVPTSIRIMRQPDFDALLTGCYKECKMNLPDSLAIYGFGDYGQPLSWNWRRGNSLVRSGSGSNYYFSPLWLPLPTFGDYRMDVTYASGCNDTSPVLSIGQKEYCDCDSITVSYTIEDKSERCDIMYRVWVTVCNSSLRNDFCLRFLENLSASDHISVLGTSFIPTTIVPGGCYTFAIDIQVRSLIPGVASFALRDHNCKQCEYVFDIDIMPSIDCEKTINTMDTVFRSDLSGSAGIYYGFTMHISGDVLALWSEPPMVMNYTANSSTGIVTGIVGITPGELSQLAADSGMICIYVIVCDNGQLCKLVCCQPAIAWDGHIQNPPVTRDEDPKGKGVGGGTQGESLQYKHRVSLYPNPTTSLVSVQGSADEAIEIMVLDMQGRVAAEFVGTRSFSVANLPAGQYIVRVRLHDTLSGAESVEYLKLVKK